VTAGQSLPANRRDLAGSRAEQAKDCETATWQQGLVETAARAVRWPACSLHALVAPSR
jgi:hypothetical protein